MKFHIRHFLLFFFVSALSATAQVDIANVGVVEDTATVGAVRIDALGETHTAAASFRQVPFAVAPDAMRKFTASGMAVTEHSIHQESVHEFDPYTVPGDGEIKAMAVHPGGDKLFVVIESGESFSGFGDELRKGLTFSNEQYAQSFSDDRISIVSLNISNELSHDPDPKGLPVPTDRSFSEAVTLKGVAYNVTDMAVSPDGGYALRKISGHP